MTRKPTRPKSTVEKLAGLADTYGKMMENASAGIQETGELKSMALQSIEPDPDQPRHNKPTNEEVEAFLAAYNEAKGRGSAKDLLDLDLDVIFKDWAPERRRIMSNLVGLAHDIKRNKLIQPIKVIRTSRPDGSIYYRIEAGERRYQAHRLLQLSHIVAISVSEPESEAALRDAQFSENFNREDLSLADRMRHLRDRLAGSRTSDLSGSGARAHGTLEKLAIEIRDMTGMSMAHARRHAAVLEDDEALNLVIEGRIPTINRAYAVAVAAPDERAAALERALAAAGDEEGVAPMPAKKSTPKGGRPKQYASLGRTKSGAVVRHVIEKVAGRQFADKYAGVDWDDFDAVTKIWTDLLKELETKLAKEG